MAKKRVHELAKQYDMPSAEVLKRLADAGIEVKAAASAVDEDAADRALTGRPQLHEEEAQKAAARRLPPRAPTAPAPTRPPTATSRASARRAPRSRASALPAPAAASAAS